MTDYRPRLCSGDNPNRKNWESLIKHAKTTTPENLIPHPTPFERWVVVTDVHRPFHNQILWSKLMRLINDMGTTLTGVVLGGDYLDLFTLSSHNAESMGSLMGMTLQDEYLDGIQGIDEIEQAGHKGMIKKFLYGNHEDRYFRHVNEKDNAKYGGALVNPVEALRLTERGWDVKTNWKDDYFTLGEHLDVIHGIYTSVHSAKTHLDKTGHSVIFGHTHRVQCFHSGNKAAFNIGGLFDMNSRGFKYMPRFQRNVWANGFAIVNVSDSGEYWVEQINIWNNKFLANGRMY